MAQIFQPKDNKHISLKVIKQLKLIKTSVKKVDQLYHL